MRGNQEYEAFGDAPPDAQIEETRVMDSTVHPKPSESSASKAATAAGTCSIKVEWPILSIDLHHAADGIPATILQAIRSRISGDVFQPKRMVPGLRAAMTAAAAGENTSNGPVAEAGETCTWVGVEYRTCSIEGKPGLMKCDKYRCGESYTYVCGECQLA